MKLLFLSVYFILQLPLSTWAQCVDESPIPPVIPPSSWTAWYNVDDPTDGTDDETLAAVRAVHPSVCVSPTQADCRVRFLHTDHVTAGQTLATGCSPAGGFLCQDADQAVFARCLDYEIRFLCPTPMNALPEPHFHWDLSTKPSITADEPMTCGGAVSSIYPNDGGMTGTVRGALYATDSFDSSDHLCAVRNQNAGWVEYGSANDKCISEPTCCTSGFTVTFWMRNRTPPNLVYPSIVLSSGGQASKARGICLYLEDTFNFDVRGFPTDSESWKHEVGGYYPDEQWTHHTFIFETAIGIKYYLNGTFVDSTNVVGSEGSGTSDFDNVVMFTSNNNPSAWPYDKIDGDFSNFKMFYKNFNDAEVLNAYLQETSESKLLIHYVRKHSHDDSFGVELECLAKAGSPPAIIWHRSDDGTYFEPVSSSVDVAIYESLSNSYRRRSVLMIRHVTLVSDLILACEAKDTIGGGSVSQKITILKRAMYWTPWMSADSPADGDDRETLNQHQLAYDLLCKYPNDIQCRTVYDGVSSNETGQLLNTNCTLPSGLECLGADQDDNFCFDYAVRYQCPEPLYRWTPWYDASDPDGTMEDETLTTHMTQGYSDLCSQPIGAECRLKNTQQDLIASGFVPEVPYLCNSNGFRCRHADNIGPCPDFEVRYKCQDLTALNLISVDSLQQQSHNLDPNLTLSCSATVGHPTLGQFALEWALLDTFRPYEAVPITSGGIVSIDSISSPSEMTIVNFFSSTYANTTLVCIARDDIIVDAKTIRITLPSFCEMPLGLSSGKVKVNQITPSTIKSPPFKVPRVNSFDPWVPAVSNNIQWLDFNLGIDFAITAVAVQGYPSNIPPTNHVTSFGLHQRDNGNDWVLYTDSLAEGVFTTDFGAGSTSFTTLTPNITTRYLRFQPYTWTNEIMVRVELYGCAVEASTLQILQLTRTYDVITDNFTLTCRVEHYPLPDITWLADGLPILPLEGALEVWDTIGVFPIVASYLTVIDFHPDNDSVTFTCVAKSGNEVEMANISTEYNFQGIVFVSRDPIVYYGSDVIVTCTASGDDIYVMEWGHLAEVTGDPFDSVQPSLRHVIEPVVNNATSWQSTLTIRQFIQADEGEYACLVNSDTARDTLAVSGRSGLWESWTNATYDEMTNSYQLECAVAYPAIEPDVNWIVPNGDGLVQPNSKYQIQNRLISIGNLTKISTLTIHRYSFGQDDGAYQCSFASVVQELNITLEAQYAYLGLVSASAMKPVKGQLVSLVCTAPEAVDRVYHADWLRVVDNGRLKIENDTTHSVYEVRGGGVFRLNLDINPYSTLADGDYVCSINNGTGEATIFLSYSLASSIVHRVLSRGRATAPPSGFDEVLLKHPRIEHMSGHGHSHGGCSGGHDHDPPDRGTEFSLYTKIDTDRVECLNEVTDGSGKLVFKPWDQRLDIEKYVESDDDEELLFNIPFTGNVKLKGVIVIGGNEDSHPAEMRLYKNRPNTTFDDMRSEPDQVFEMQRDTSGILEYNTKIARFSNVNHLSIHFSKNFGAETSIVYYIGLRGDFTEAYRQEIMVVQYEAVANPKDHKTSLFDNVQHEIS